MKAVMSDVPRSILQWRERTGASQRDEMWEGVLHMVPEPTREHQDLEGALETWLRTHWARPLGNRVYHRINLTPADHIENWMHNYRTPDLVLLTPDRLHIDHNEFFAGGPTAVVEIRSPGDETHEKRPFYARLGVPEMWIIERDTRAVQLLTLEREEYIQQGPRESGWLYSEATGVELRSSETRKVMLRMAGDDATAQALPED